MSSTLPSSPAIEAFVLRLKRRQIGKYQRVVAIETVHLLRGFIHQAKDPKISNLLSQIKALGKRLTSLQPHQLSLTNIIRRVLKIIREEVADHLQQQADRLCPPSPAAGVNGLPQTNVSSFSVASANCTYSAARQRNSQYLDSGMYNLIALDRHQQSFPSAQSSNGLAALEAKEPLFFPCKSGIMQAINEFIDDLESMDASIAAQSLEHIHSNEVIMTHGLSKSVEEFLLYAARKRKFKLIVAEGSPSFEGQELALNLSRAGIDTTLVPESAVYALMSRVNKVILGCGGVLANGGIVAQSGALMLASAAKQHSTPILVLAPIYKLSPIYPHDLNKLNLQTNPHNVVSYNYLGAAGGVLEEVEILSPAYDYVPPRFVSTFVTNVGGNSPSYIYRLLEECYCEEDLSFEQE